MLNPKQTGKIAMTLTLAAIMLLSITPAFAFKNGLTTAGRNFITFEGAAATDSYDSRQWSYDVNTWAAANIAGYPALNPANMWFNASKSLRVGMTEYGEFSAAPLSGMAYGSGSAEWLNSESFAAAGIPQQYWVNGWDFYMNYSRTITPGFPAALRCIEGYAIFSNGTNVEGGRQVWSWFGAFNPTQVGAVLTQGRLVTSGIEIIYDSARLAIGRCSVTIQDGYFNFENVAQITLTIIYNKDMKYAIIYKDVKMLLPDKIFAIINDFAFSERYEIDMAAAINPSNQAYIHYFANNMTSVYQHPLTGSNKVDVLQAFDFQRRYTFFAAYWPNATEYSVWAPIIPDLQNGFTTVLPYGTAIADINQFPYIEPFTPEVIVQWRYNSTSWPKLDQFLTKDPNREIRFVEIAGMTDYNGSATSNTAYAPFRAQDVQAGDSQNYIDTEIQYMIQSVINPLDLTNLAGASSDNTPLWTGLGQASAASDSAGASVLSDIWASPYVDGPFPLFDKNDTSPMKGTIPFGLSQQTTGNYLNTLQISASGGSDPTTYVRTGLINFAFNTYNNVTSYAPQPVSGGVAPSTSSTGYWYPSINPLNGRWSYSGNTYTAAQYDTVNVWKPNGIITVGGPKANGLARYFNDFYFAIDRETGTQPASAFAPQTMQLNANGQTAFSWVSGGNVYGFAPTSNPTGGTIDFYPVSTWNTATAAQAGTGNPSPIVSYSNPASNLLGYAVISIARDVNGTRGISVYGWDARDTYWASAWATQWVGSYSNYWIPAGTVALILQISYTTGSNEPSLFTVVRDLGTITELGSNHFITAYGSVAGAFQDVFNFGTVWTGNLALPAPPTFVLPSTAGAYWWYAKVPTSSTALVDFDS